MSSYLNALMNEYTEAHPDAIPVESSLNTPAGRLKYQEQMKDVLEPEWERLEQACSDSWRDASFTRLR